MSADRGPGSAFWKLANGAARLSRRACFQANLERAPEDQARVEMDLATIVGGRAAAELQVEAAADQMAVALHRK